MDSNAYTYYTVPAIGSGLCPLYLCVGTNEERKAFMRDVTAIGLITRNLDTACLAVDPISPGVPDSSLGFGCAMIELQQGIVPKALLQNEQKGPFPITRTFSISTVWQMIGRVTTEARTLEEAMDKVIIAEGLPTESYYLDDSQEIDLESGIEVK